MTNYYYSSIILFVLGILAWKRGEKARGLLNDELRLIYSDLILKNKIKFMIPYIILWGIITTLTYETNINYEYLFIAMFLLIIVIMEVTKFVFFKKLKQYDMPKDYFYYKKQQVLIVEIGVFLYLAIAWSLNRIDF